MKQNIRYLKNQRGDALIAALMFGAVALVIIGGLASMMITMQKMQKSSNLSDEQKDTMNQLNYLLSFPNVCSTAFAGQNVIDAATHPADVSHRSALAAASIKINGAVRNLNPAALPEIGPGLTLNYLGFEGKSTAPTVETIGAGPATMPVYNGFLIVGTQKTNASLFSPAYKEIKIPMAVGLIGNNVGACASGGPEGTACEAMGNIWLPLAAVGHQCVRPSSCLVAGGFSSMATTGGFNNPLTNGQTCPSGFVPRETGTVAIASNCGKSCVNNTYQPVFTCTRCFDATGSLTNAGAASAADVAAGPSGTSLDLSGLEDVGDDEGDYETGIQHAVGSHAGSWLSHLGISFL